MFLNVPKPYKKILSKEFFEDQRFKNLDNNIKYEYEKKSYNVLPRQNLIFRALELTPPEDVRVVILGYDPYPNNGYPDGLCFSSNINNKGYSKLQSLKNIFNKLEISPTRNSLEPWARQGVLLLNSILTVQEGFSGSHKMQGWQYFTDEIIKALSRSNEYIVFILLGKEALKKEKYIDSAKNDIVKASHPSNRSKGREISGVKSFDSCNVFSETNALLKKNNKSTIDWKCLK